MLRVERRRARIACIIVLVARSGEIWIYFEDKLDVFTDWMGDMIRVKVNIKDFGQYH